MRKRELRNKYLVASLLVLIAFITVGFAALQSNLNINGTVATKSNSWNIYFDNIVLNQGSVSKTAPTLVDQTTISFSVQLGTPGDFYEFSVAAVNDGTLDAMVRTITATNLTEEQAKLIDLSYTYEDGTPIESKDYLKSSTRETIKVSVKYKEDVSSEDLPNSNMELPITITLEYVQADETAKEIEHVQKGVNLYNLMKENASSDTINFSVNSMTSGTNGIYTTTNTEGNVPVYYYRGKVNNNVIFNNMCWKIIRTTETGGVKLIYNGTPNAAGECVATGTDTQIGTSAFNANCNRNAYVGYMYGETGATTYAATHTNTNDSTIKTYLEGTGANDGWFNTSGLKNYQDRLEDTIFCNDRSTVDGTNNNTLGSSYGTLGYGTNLTGYGAVARSSYFTTSPNPTYACPQASDKFTLKATQTNYNSNLNGNKKLDYPVGLITLDEVIFAGFNTYESNNSNYQDTNNYLYTGSDYWTISPVGFTLLGCAVVGYVYKTGYVYSSMAVLPFGVRPVISIKTGVLIENGGTGTPDNPYVVQ